MNVGEQTLKRCIIKASTFLPLDRGNTDAALQVQFLPENRGTSVDYVYEKFKYDERSSADNEENVVERHRRTIITTAVVPVGGSL